jgi:hypothetical protein
MATAFRLALPLLAALLATSTTRAQPPVAPAPHPPLAEVVAEYKRLGLPFPPPDAELVQIDWREYTAWYDGEPKEPRYILAYRIPARKPDGRPKYFKIDVFGIGFWNIESFDVAAVEEVKPTADLLQLVQYESGTHLLALAVQGKARGWNELAEAAYSRAIEKLAEDESYRSVIGELRIMACLFWQEPLYERGGDRKEALRRLTALVKEEPSLLTPRREKLLDQLELTVAPRKSKPGSAEALIDELTEYFTENPNGPFMGWEAPKDPASYWKLAELGFDAVPALIEHVTDDRLTRSARSGFQPTDGYNLTVGHLCSKLLFDLSGRTIGGGYWELRGDRLSPAEAQKWFNEAKKVGEEKWLLDHAIPADGGQGIVNQVGRPEPHIVRVIGAKYPERLPAIYRAMLRKVQAESLIGDFVNEVVASKLPLKEKVSLLEEGAAHKRPDHRFLALDGLAKLDRAALRKHLLPTLKRIEGQGGNANVGRHIAGTLCKLVETTGDIACWDALIAAAKAVGVDDRMAFVGGVVPHRLPDPKDPQRLERIRFLLQFLDDRTAEVDDFGSGPIVTEVRDYAATMLAGELDFPVRRTFFFQPVHDATLGPFSRLWLRVAVRQAATRELAAGKP